LRWVLSTLTINSIVWLLFVIDVKLFEGIHQFMSDEVY